MYMDQLRLGELYNVHCTLYKNGVVLDFSKIMRVTSIVVYVHCTVYMDLD